MEFRNKPRKKRSILWDIDTTNLKNVVSTNYTISDILNHFNLSKSGGTRLALIKRLTLDKIDYSHIKRGLSHNKGKKLPNKAKLPLNIVMVENSSYGTGLLKCRLLADNILQNKCNKCSVGPIWNNEKLVLVLDHINGINNDHRLENLRILCPNCHSQTPTFAGRNIKNKRCLIV